MFFPVWLVLLFTCVFAGCGDSDPQEARLPRDSVEHSEPLEDTEAKTPALTDRVVALVNDEEITLDEFAARLHVATRRLSEDEPIDEYTLNRLRESSLQELVNERLIAQQAVKQQISVSDDEIEQQRAKLMEEYHVTEIQPVLDEQGLSYEEWEKVQYDRILLEKLVDLNMSSMIRVTEEEVRQAYEQNKEKYDHAAQVRAQQILTYDESLAQEALQKLRDGTDFAQVAREYSDSQDADVGGDLGFFEEGVMPPEFDEVVFSLELGEMSPIVKTPYGYQIFMLLERREASRVSFEEVKTQIEERLKQQKRMFAIDLWMLDLQKEAKILLNHTAMKQVE